VWNRVFLLAAGVASGWTLVHLLTVAPGQAPTHRWRLILALIIGVGQVALLTTVSLQAGLTAVFVFLFSALVAYAANAKQVSKAPEPILPRRPSLPPKADPRVLALMVVDGDPAAYEGPQYWAQAYRQRQARGERIPHWFVRPLAYARVRAAYAVMGRQHPLDTTLSKTTGELEAHLGPGYAVRYAYLRSQPYLVRALVALAEEGFRRLVIVPLGSAVDEAAIRQAVADSRIRELGLKVFYAPVPQELPGQSDLYSDHLPTLHHGHPLNIAPSVTSDQIQGIADLVVQVSRKG
jgi:hypothetical protein